MNRMLLMFMLAMILANIGGEMYGMLLPLYLEGAECQCSADRVILHHLTGHPAGGADPGRLGFRFAGAVTQYRLGKCGGQPDLRGFHLCTHLAVGDEWDVLQRDHTLADRTELQCLYR